MILIRVTTLFDITRTNVRFRRYGGSVDSHTDIQRGQQSNFETILQIIGMRCQPEDISDPEKKMVNSRNSINWGTSYSNRVNFPVWSFEFTISHDEVYTNEDGKLGKLLQDCDGIPMITGLEESPMLVNVISVTPTHKNIYFEAINDR